MDIGRLLIFLGVILVLFGIIYTYFGMNLLPGDIVIERDNFTIIVPIVTSIVLSIILSLILWALR